MDTHEGRLRAMIDPDIGRAWILTGEDRAAIRWALDAIEKLKAERDEVRAEFSASAHRSWEKTKMVEAAADELTKAIRGD